MVHRGYVVDRAVLCVVVLAMVAEAAHAKPAADMQTDIVGDDVTKTPPASFEETNAGVVQVDAERVSTPNEDIGDDDDDTFGDVVLVGSERGFYCTGVVVSRRSVLTARHCADATRVGLGSTASAAVVVRVTAVARHPRLDVALLALATPITVRMHARRSPLDAAPPAGMARLLGFGVRDHLRLTGFGTKRHVNVDIDGWGCTSARAGAIGCAAADELVVRGGQGNDTCLGDSGGPVFERVDDEWRLIAITSRGMRPRKVICGEGGIYTRVDRIGAWLDKEAGK